ncbi:polysaccharide lyase 6 family protein [Persicobacter psychrovividus]|uniref:Poly(Beta-D-mannuronate) lyase n=1 Tax=Persicobacter psychrovividus TaxID=387638 RepID=A0ABM7VJ24_9BACT|nr:hypothetical protein PEPS_32630 [Persicobacter psychrovividus]
MKQLFTPFFCLAFLLSACNFSGKDGLVTTADGLQKAISTAQAGDTIRMAAGVWNDTQIAFKGQGTQANPIVLMAEEKGKTILSGNSSLALAGEYLQVHGLVFKDGYAKGRVAVAFKIGDEVAKHCRLSEVVMDHYNPADRFEKTSWVELYGQHNEIDHCYFGGKLNAGVLMAVKLNNVESRQNFHHIHDNYFGFRPKLGSNGGETLRVGVSTYCEMSSNTLIERNLFERCSGEVEVVSIKSSDNIIKDNLFIACEGVLALRHGDRNQVLGNYFLGENLANAGGVRVINGGHTIENNYFQDLAGRRFFGPLPIMNGVPNSLANRYIRAHDVLVKNNKFFNCPNIELCVGADRERTQTPDHITISDNLFYNPAGKAVFTKLDDISGFTFNNNAFVNDGSSVKTKGLVRVKTAYEKNQDGLYASAEFTPKLPVDKNKVGVSWYTPTPETKQLVNTTVTVNGFEALVSALNQAKDGTTIQLAAGSDFEFNHAIHITKNVKIINGHSTRVNFKYVKNTKQESFFVIDNGGDLSLKGIAFNGRSETGIVKAGIRTSDEPMIEHYNLKVEDCSFSNFDAADYTAFRAFTSTFADKISFINCDFNNISGIALNINGQKDDKGRYSAEEVVIENCRFEKVMTGAMEITRMGNDESTTGPYVTVRNCDFVDVGNKELGSVVMLWGVQKVTADNLFFYNSGCSGRTIRFEDPLWAVSSIDHILSVGSGKIESYYPRRGKHISEFAQTEPKEKALSRKVSTRKNYTFGAQPRG